MQYTGLMTRYQKVLALALAAVFIWSAVHPQSQSDWFLENIPILLAVVPLCLMGRHFKLSNISYTLIVLYLVLPLIGSHFGVAGVPFGYTLGHIVHSDRNMYDRLVHFSFGFLWAYPIREIYIKLTQTKGFWSYYVPFDIVLSFSAIYEIFEWAIGVSVNPALGADFLGAQGDFFDTSKDMAVAGTGALAAMIIIYFINRRSSENSVIK